VQTRKPDSGELRGQEEIEGIAKECLALVIGEGHADVVKEVKPNSISESGAQKLTKVQQLLTRPDSAVYLVEWGEVWRSGSESDEWGKTKIPWPESSWVRRILHDHPTLKRSATSPPIPSKSVWLGYGEELQITKGSVLPNDPASAQPLGSNAPTSFCFPREEYSPVRSDVDAWTERIGVIGTPVKCIWILSIRIQRASAIRLSIKNLRLST
jgi:hypothetical protein